MRVFLLSLLCACAVAVVIMLFWLVPAITAVGYSNQSYQYKDSLHMALQLGRLDFATVLLTVLTVFLIIASLISFSYFRNIAEQEAKAAARLAAAAAAENYIEQQMPALIETLYSMVDERAVTGTQANQIAGAQDDDDN